MLILGRRYGQSIIVNPGTPDEMKITLLNRHGNNNRLGIEAPLHINIVREELIPKENRKKEWIKDDNDF